MFMGGVLGWRWVRPRSARQGPTGEGGGACDSLAMESAARQYAVTVSTSDVLATFEWLEGSGFVVVASDDQPGTHMGDVWLLYERSAALVEIKRDRGLPRLLWRAVPPAASTDATGAFPAIQQARAGFPPVARVRDDLDAPGHA